MSPSLATWFRWLEVAAEVLFLSSTAAVFVGLAGVAPDLRPLVHALLPLGLSYTAMRRGWRLAMVVGLTSVAMMSAYPLGYRYWGYYLADAIPIGLAAIWAVRTRRRASTRWWATIIAFAAGDLALAEYSTGRMIYTIKQWAVHPVAVLLARAGLSSPAAAPAWLQSLWPLWWTMSCVLWGSAIFLLLSYFLGLGPVTISRIPKFGRWHMPLAWLPVVALLGSAVIVQLIQHQANRWLVMGTVSLLAAYGVLGTNVLWDLGRVLRLSPSIRVVLLLLLLAASWLGITVMVAIGLFDSLWQWRQRWDHWTETL